MARLTARKLLQESDDIKKAVKIEPLKRTLVKYVTSGNIFRPAGDVGLAENLSPCAYEIKHDMQGLYFERVIPKTDEFFVFEDSPMRKVVEEIDRFWNRESNFKNLGLVHCRGVILYGPPG